MGQEFHGELRVHGVSDREPNALAQGAQGVGLIGLEKDIAGVGGGFEVLQSDEGIERLPTQGPGLCTALQIDQGAGDLQLAVGNRVVPVDNFMIYKDIIRLDRPD